MIRKRILAGRVEREIQLKNKKAKLEIQNTVDYKISFQSSGAVIAFNGGGNIAENDPMFTEAYNLSKKIIEKGGIIINGGRDTGIMEATSRAAKKFGVGINFAEQKAKGLANKHGSTVIVDSATTRLDLLTLCPPIVIVYNGGLGTLQELMNSLVAIKNHQKYKLADPPLLILYKSWQPILNFLKNKRAILPQFLALIKYFKTTDDVLKRIF